MNAQVFVMALTSCYERSNSVRPARRPSSTQFGRANKQPHSLAPSSSGAIFLSSRRTSTQCSVCNNRLCSRLTKSLHRISELRLVSALSPRERSPTTAEHTGTIGRDTGRRRVAIRTDAAKLPDVACNCAGGGQAACMTPSPGRPQSLSGLPSLVPHLSPVLPAPPCRQ